MTSREVVLDGGLPWGFRMHGGADNQQPLKISRVNPGSKAALKGVREGDLITSINDQPTKDLTNAEAHALLKNAGDTLKLGLNQDRSGSPKRRNYNKTVLQESHSETVKRSSFSTLTITSSSNPEDIEKSNERTTETTRRTNGEAGHNVEESTHIKPRENGLISQRSTLSSNCSTASTPSTLESRGGDRREEHYDDVPSNDNAESVIGTSPNSPGAEMADNTTSRSRRRRNRRKAKKLSVSDSLCGDMSEEISPSDGSELFDFKIEQKESETSGIATSVNIKVQKLQKEEEYRVESPKTLPKEKPPSKTSSPVVKSKSLDDDETLRITELSEASESEDKNAESNSAIISEVESDLEWGETTETFSETKTSTQKGSLNTFVLELQEHESVQETTSISPEDELHLRHFLEGLHLVSSPEEASAKVQEKKSTPDLKTKRAKKREELTQYFLPVYQNPRYLDAISEEGSDLSDREQKEKRKAAENQAKMDLKADAAESLPTKPPLNVQNSKVKSIIDTKRIQKRMESHYQCPINEKAILVGTKLIESPSTVADISKTNVAEASSSVEIVYLEDSSASESCDEDNIETETDEDRLDTLPDSSTDSIFQEYIDKFGIDPKEETESEELTPTNEANPIENLVKELEEESINLTEAEMVTKFIKNEIIQPIHPKNLEETNIIEEVSPIKELREEAEETIAKDELHQFKDDIEQNKAGTERFVKVELEKNFIRNEVNDIIDTAAKFCEIESVTHKEHIIPISIEGNCNSGRTEEKQIPLSTNETIKTDTCKKEHIIPITIENTRKKNISECNTTKTETNEATITTEKLYKPKEIVHKITLDSENGGSGLKTNVRNVPIETQNKPFKDEGKLQDKGACFGDSPVTNTKPKTVHFNDGGTQKKFISELDSFSSSSKIEQDITFCQLTPPPTPDNTTPKSDASFEEEPDEFVKHASILLSHGNLFQLRCLVKDRRFSQLSNDIKEKINSKLADTCNIESKTKRELETKTLGKAEEKAKIIKIELEDTQCENFEKSIVKTDEEIKAQQDKENVLIKDLQEATYYVNALSPPPPSRSPSAASDSGSSMTTSQITVQFNPMASSSVGDIASILKDEEKIKNSVPTKNPPLLKDLCLKTLMSLPFGTDVLEELAEVSKGLQDQVTRTDNSAHPIPISEQISKIAQKLPAFIHRLEEENKSNESFDVPVGNEMDIENKWVGVPTDQDPKVLICLSPTQKEQLEKTRRVSQEADKLLDLHEKFANRRGYNEEIKETKHTETKTLSDVSISTVTKTWDSNQQEDGSKLLAILRDSADQKDKKPEVPPKINVSKKKEPTPDDMFLYYEENDNVKVPHQFQRSISSTLPRDLNQARLKARDLSEWLHLAREKSTSDTNLAWTQPFPDFNMRPAVSAWHLNSTIDQEHFHPGFPRHGFSLPYQEQFVNRRASLPQEFYERQMEFILRKEKEIQDELERLEAEKKRLTERTINEEIQRHFDEKQAHFDPNQYIFSKKLSQDDLRPLRPDKPRPKSMPMAPTEFFRQQMYDEYMDQIAAREERKQNKVIKISSAPHTEDNINETAKKPDQKHVSGIEDEFMNKVKQRMDKYGLKYDESDVEGPAKQLDQEDATDPVLVMDGSSLLTRPELPKHLREFVDITRHSHDEFSGDGIWSPGQSTSTESKYDEPTSIDRDDEDPILPVWTPKSAGASPTPERKEFRPVAFESPKLSRKNKPKSDGSGETTPIEPPWKAPNSSSDLGIALASSLEKRLPTSYSAPASGFQDIQTPRLPRAQNPTITLLQKAREGQIPKGASYIEQYEHSQQTRRAKGDKGPSVSPGEIIYQIKNEYTSESDSEKPRKMADLGPRKFEGIGPTTRDGMPLVLRSEVKDQNQSKWYKRMYDTIHKQRHPDDEYVMVRYKQRRGRYPYMSGYLSEPEPGAYDSDAALSDHKYATLDRRRPQTRDKENDYMSSTMPRSAIPKYSSDSVIKHSKDTYKNQPGRIENYVPGHSSISDKEAKEWWDEVMDIFDGHLEQQKLVPPSRSFMNQALKESGYESDSTLVFRRREDAMQQLNPLEQREVYKNIQKGGDVPLHGLRKPAPERPKDDTGVEFVKIGPVKNLRAQDHPVQIFCYPVSIPDHPKQVFGNVKRTVRSASPNIPKPPPMPPSPPRRKSSRNNSTLRLISNMKGGTDKSPTSKRHETCFTPSSEMDKTKVKYLRDKLANKLSPLPKKKLEQSGGLSKLKLRAASLGAKPKTTQSISSSKSSINLSKSSLSDRSPDRCCSIRSSSASPVRRICKPCSSPLKEQPSTTKGRGTSLERTFGTEKRRDLTVPKISSRAKLAKSPDLKSTPEVKKVSLSQITSLPPGITYKKTSSLSGSKSSLLKLGSKIVPKPRDGASLPSTPLSLRSLRIRSTSASPVPSLQSEKSKTKSNTSLSSIGSSKIFSRKPKKIEVIKPPKQISKTTTQMPTKKRKDLLNGEIAKKDKSKKVKEKKTQPFKKSVSKNAGLLRSLQEIEVEPSTALEEIKRQKEYVQTDSFFQNLFLRGIPPSDIPTPIPVSHRANWVAEKTMFFQKSKPTYSEPSVGALKIYLNHTKPVTDSKFKSLDAALTRSRSVSPIIWKYESRLSKPPRRIVSLKEQKERSSSMPPKLVFTETSRPVSPVLKKKSVSLHKEMRARSSSPPKKLVFTETSRPISPILKKKTNTVTTHVRARSSSPITKMIFTETSRPISPLVGRKLTKDQAEAILELERKARDQQMNLIETSPLSSPIIERRITRSSSPRYLLQNTFRDDKYDRDRKLFFTETSRPVSPVVERRQYRSPSPRRIIWPKRSESPSPARIILTETSRPVSPVVERKRTHAIPSARSPPESKMFFTETSRPVSPVVQHKIPEPPPLPKSLSDKLYFTESYRPVSPIFDRKRDVPSPSYKLIQRTSEKNKRNKAQRAKSASEADRKDFMTYPTNLSQSTTSIDSCDRAEYQGYVKELFHSTRKSEKFKELNNFYATLEKLGELERTTSSADLRPRRKYEDEIIDYDRWQEVRQREKAEKELKVIYKQLKEDQREKGLLFLPKDVERYRWRRELDRGLRIKEKSVENIKGEFEKLKHMETEQEAAKLREIAWMKDNYKPLWRGNSVVNLANNMVEKRSHSEGRVSKLKARDIEKDRSYSQGIGNRIWSSLSMEQVNLLKNQLAEIYNQNDSPKPKVPKNTERDNYINVPPERLQSYPTTLRVRRNSDSSDHQVYLKPKSRVFDKKPNELNGQNILSESEKKKLSQSLSKEVMGVVSKKYKTSMSVVLGKETRGAIAAKEANVKVVQDTYSPRTCHSLDVSVDGQIGDGKQESQDDFILLCTGNQDANIKQKVESEQPKKALVKTDATVPKLIPNSETESGSTDGSTKTVVYVGNKDEVQKKVEYFESAAEREVFTPTIYKPADSGGSDESDNLLINLSDESNKDKESPSLRKGDQSRSQSYQDLKELFGEQELVKFATLPLSATRKQEYTAPPKPQFRSVSPIKSIISDATSYESICRSRSLSPFLNDSTLAVIKTGDVNRLKERFEFFEDGDSLRPRRCKSDPQLNRKGQISIPGLPSGEVDNLRRRYEYPAYSGRGRSRYRRGGVVSPLSLRAEDRFMPHINIISKIASLKRASSPTKEKSRSTEELADILGIPVGEVEKLRQKFDSPDRSMSLLGQMFTSSPDMQELRDIAPYLTGNWTAHRYPKSEDNTRSLSSPENSFPSRDTNLVRKDRYRPKSASPPRPKTKLSSILKTHLPKDGPIKALPPSARYHHDEKTEPIRYRSWWPSFSTHNRPTVTFKEPEGPPPPPKGHRLIRDQDPESPRKYVENEVTIHYKTPVRHEVKEALSEEELARRQAEAMKKIYQEERRRKYLQVSQSLDELQDMNSRRHTDNFIPSQKSPIPLNRYDDFISDLSPKIKPRPRSPEPRLVARALYNFVGQSARELTFRKGDIIFVRRQVDKNWFEGEFNAMVGLFPANYVEIIPYDGVKTTPRKAHEGQARAKFNFIAQTHLELSLAKGELVVITRRVDDNWFEGKIGGRKGIFPVSYVEVLIDPNDPPPAIGNSKPIASPAAHSLLLNGSSGGKESMGSHSYNPTYPNPQITSTSYHAKPVQLSGSGTYASLNRRQPMNQTLHIDTQSEPIPYRALYKYKPQNDDELELLEGDTVYVLEKCDDGWYVGSSDRTGAFGTFPGNYVERI